MVAFLPGENTEPLVSAAWAEVEGRPRRRNLRLPTETPVTIRPLASGTETTGRLTDVSARGLGIHTVGDDPDTRLRAGERVVVETSLGCAWGIVRWCTPAAVGVEVDETAFPPHLLAEHT